MGAYEYSALDDRGRQRQGVLAGDTARQVRQQLREQGLSPLSVAPVGEDSSTRGGIRMSRTEQALALRQLASLLTAGLTVEESLATVAQQSDRGSSRRVLTALRSRVMEGHALSAAMAEYPRAFPHLVRATVAAGEQSGQLDRVLEKLADDAENRDALGRKVLLAALYPTIVAFVAFATLLGLLTYVVPQVVTVFASMDQDLPWLTRTLITFSSWLTEYGAAIFLVLVVLLAGLALGLRVPAVREVWDRAKLKIPLAGRLVRAVNTARYARTLSILTGSAVPLLEGLKISGEVLENRHLRNAAADVAHRVREGSSLYRAMEQTRAFPPLVVRLVASGEKSGELDQMLARAAEHQERQVESQVAVTMGILEPALILVVGGLVLAIVLAILLPIFQLNQLTTL
ncbi:MAG: type II secretion system inner membrane protein GspF [Pseudomonadota bacterium]